MLHQVGPIPLKYLLLQFQPVQPALPDRQALPAPLVLTGLTVQMVLPVLPDLKVLQVLQALQVLKDPQVQQDLKDPKG